jgi:hypothetical protein
MIFTFLTPFHFFEKEPKAALWLYKTKKLRSQMNENAEIYTCRRTSVTIKSGVTWLPQYVITGSVYPEREIRD